jgi:hypothetical protein
MITQQENIEDLLRRYRLRLSSVYTNPNPYYEIPIWELSEIKEWIKKLEKINKNK